MLSFRKVGMAGVFALVANVAAAQSIAPTSARDSLWNGTLIGLGAGFGSTVALDAAFCENGFGDCDFPRAAYLTLGGIGAAAGAGIDFAIRRTADERTTTLRLAPIVRPTRRGMLGSLELPQPGSLPPLEAGTLAVSSGLRDSVWDGAFIGAGVGAVSGAVWSVKTCSPNDQECLAITGPVGIIGGVAIGAAIGAIADAMRN